MSPLLLKAAVAAVAVAGGVILWTGYIGGIERAADAKGYARASEEARIASAAQAERNRELQRAAELRYTVQSAVRDRFIVKTVTEVRYATTHLAACPVGAAGVRLLNDAALCARGDSPSACGAGEPLRKP